MSRAGPTPDAAIHAGINWIKQGDNWPADDPFNRGVPNVPAGYPSHFSGNFWWASAAFWHTLPDGFLGASPRPLKAAGTLASIDNHSLWRCMLYTRNEHGQSDIRFMNRSPICELCEAVRRATL